MDVVCALNNEGLLTPAVLLLAMWASFLSFYLQRSPSAAL